LSAETVAFKKLQQNLNRPLGFIMKNVLVIGMGKVGSLVGVLLSKRFAVTGFDRKEPAAKIDFPFVKGDVSDLTALGLRCRSVLYALQPQFTHCQIGAPIGTPLL
jgi:hypothetical protein